MSTQIIKKSQELMKSYETGLKELSSSQEKDSKSMGSLTKLLGFLRSLEIYYHHAHWVTKGDSYYGDHLLFEKLYKNSRNQTDSLAEKMVGILGEESVSFQEVSEVISKIASSAPKMDKNITGFELAKYALGLEMILLEMLNRIYDSMKKSGAMTMGFDDLLMGMYNDHEGHIYLLQQRTKKLE